MCSRLRRVRALSCPLHAHLCAAPPRPLQVPKSAERTPQRTIYLWYVDLKAAMLAALSEHTKVLLNTQLRLMDERARSEAAGEYQGPLPHAEELLLLKVPGRVEHECARGPPARRSAQTHACRCAHARPSSEGSSRELTAPRL